VNDEKYVVRSGLAAALCILGAGGRLAVITFHSVEDRLVKEFGREQSRDYTVEGPVDVPALRQPRAPVLRWVQRKAIQPGAGEVAENPRARSARLREMGKLERLKWENNLRAAQLANLQMPQRLMERVKEQKLGLVPSQSSQWILLVEPAAPEPTNRAPALFVLGK